MRQKNRTAWTFGSLIGGMTLVSGLLLALEPGPVDAPPTGLNPLTAATVNNDPTKILFNTSTPRQWQRIIIHASPMGFRGDGEEALNAFYRSHGMAQGAGYHFVIRRDGGQFGPVEISQRWRQQLPGGIFYGTQQDATAQGLAPDYFDRINGSSIGICLIGDGASEPFTAEQQDQLFWLLGQLVTRCNISADQIDAGTAAGVLFPHAALNRMRVELAQGI